MTQTTAETHYQQAADQAIGLAQALAKGQPDRVKIMREGIAAAAREPRDAPGTLF
jgi:hypothetical protein